MIEVNCRFKKMQVLQWSLISFLEMHPKSWLQFKLNCTASSHVCINKRSPVPAVQSPPSLQLSSGCLSTGSVSAGSDCSSTGAWVGGLQCPSPGRGSSLRAVVSTVDGGCAMCSVGGVWGELVCTCMSSDWRLPSTWFWVGVLWRSKEKAITKCKHKSQHLSCRGSNTRC